MEGFERIAELSSEAQASALDALLEERGIAHITRTYHDSALDGVFQAVKGWGHVEAPPEHRDEILAILAEME